MSLAQSAMYKCVRLGIACRLRSVEKCCVEKNSLNDGEMSARIYTDRSTHTSTTRLNDDYINEVINSKYEQVQSWKKDRSNSWIWKNNGLEQVLTQFHTSVKMVSVAWY